MTNAWLYSVQRNIFENGEKKFMRFLNRIQCVLVVLLFFFIVFSICILIQKNGLHSYILTYPSVWKSFKMNLKEMTYPNTRKHILDMVKIISYLVSYVGWNWSCAANIHTIGLFHWITVGRLWSIPSCTSFMIATTTQTSAHTHACTHTLQTYINQFNGRLVWQSASLSR